MKATRTPDRMDPATAIGAREDFIDLSEDDTQASCLREFIGRRLEREIVSGSRSPGSPIEPDSLAADLGVEPGVVHHALGALAAARLVVPSQDDRSHVRVIDMGEALSVCEVLAALELLLGRLAAKSARPADIDELRELVRAMGLAARRGDARPWHDLDRQFHDKLARMTRNATLLVAYRTAANEFELYLRRAPEIDPHDLRIPTREHHDIVEAIARGKGNRTANLLHAHAIGLLARLREQVEASGGAGRVARGRIG